MATITNHRSKFNWVKFNFSLTNKAQNGVLNLYQLFFFYCLSYGESDNINNPDNYFRTDFIDKIKKMK